MFDKYNTGFEYSLNKINEKNQKGEDVVGTGEVDNIEKVYKNVNTEYYYAYKEYIDQITSGSDPVKTFTEFGGDYDVFNLSDHVFRQDKKSQTPMVEYSLQRQNLVDKMELHCVKGFDTLNVAMRTEMKKQKQLNTKISSKM